ncbi:MAG TPA: histidine phosphatase family protein [Nitrososphaeraceae archaeon]|nr:histidine phosphatase family protein [Nitrososphaeraceae archaeon]
MKTLLLLRHAKSSWNDKILVDHKRPLNQRGKKDAPIMGEYLKKKKLTPDLIISSTAKRAKDTSKLVGEHCGYNKDIQESELLYGTTSRDYLTTIGEISDKHHRVLLIGHNPILEEVLEIVTGEQIIMKTCSLAHISLPIKFWSEVKHDTNTKGKLIDVVKVKKLNKDSS